MADDTQPPPQAPPDLNAAIQALIQQQLRVASGQGQQVQLPSAQPPPSMYSNDPSQGPDLISRIGLALGGGSLPGAPAALREQMGRQALMNFGIGLMSAGRFATPGEVLAGGFRGAQQGLLGSEAAQAGQQEYALNAQAKLAELGLAQQKNRTEALQAVVPLLQMQGRLGLPPLFGPGSQAGPPGGGPGGGGGDIYGLPKDQFLPAVAQRESGGDPTALNYVARADPTAYARGATASGKYQMVNSTWLTAAKAAGIDTTKYPTAMSAPEALQDKAASWLYDNQGTAPWDPSKWTKNWVLGSDGKYTLQTAPYTGPPGASKGTPPTQSAGSPPAASSPGDGKLPVPPVPPSTPPTARAVGPFGAGAFAPPAATVAAPPATTASAPNVDTPLPNVPTPAMTAAVAQARRTGKPALIEGANGAMVGPDGRFISNVGTLGKRADADAILQGVLTAQTSLPPAGAVAAAGPGAGGGTTPTPAQPAPEGAFGGGAFATAPPRAVGPIATAAATPPPPAAQPPAAQPPVATPPPPPPTRDIMARNPDGSFVVPDDKVSVPEYQARNRQPPSPEEMQQRGMVLPENPTAIQAAYAGVQQAERDANAARQAAQTTYIQGGDPAKALEAVNNADKQAQDARTAYTNLIQGASEKNALALQNFYKDQDAQLAAAHKDILDRQAASALEAQRGRQQIAQTDESQRIAYINSQQGKLDEEASKARENLWQLDMLHGLSEASGGANPLGDLEIGGRSARDWLLASGIGTPSQVATWTAQDAFKAAITKFAQDMRAGQGMGRLTNQELTVLMQMLPNTGMDPGAREAILSYMGQVYQRKSDFALHTANHLSDLDQNGKPVNFSSAMDAADRELGPIMPQVPPEASGSIAARDKWLSTLRPNTLFRNPDGSVGLYRGQTSVGGQ